MKTVFSALGLCPTSGLMIYGQQVPDHFVNLQGLENGIVMGYCANHLTRWFIGDRGACFDIKANAKVVQTLYKKPLKGGKSGEAQGKGSVGTG